NLGIYRKFAACDVWISIGPVAVGRNGESADSTVAAEEAIAPRPFTPPPPPVVPEPPPLPFAPEPIAPEPVVEREPPPAPAAVLETASVPSAAPNCAFCAEPLPTGRPVTFCPFCGKDQRQRPCPACAEVLERGWRFCIACGTPVDGSQ